MPANYSRVRNKLTQVLLRRNARCSADPASNFATCLSSAVAVSAPVTFSLLVFFQPIISPAYWFLRSCSSSSADLKRNAALSLYPVISCLTAVISAGLSLCVSKGLFFILRSVGPSKIESKTFEMYKVISNGQVPEILFHYLQPDRNNNNETLLNMF